MQKFSLSPNTLTVSASLLLGLLFLHADHYLRLGLDSPALDHYNFRQTQTALSAYWLWHDGFSLVYNTPVVGAPWAIPFEFPLYQWMVAFLRLLGVPIDVGGRLISFGFYVGTLYPLWILNKELGLRRLTWVVVAALFLASPFYIFWARSVMIESTALFFSVLMLALVAKYFNDGSWWTLVLALIAGTLAVLTKSTTFPAYAFLAGLLVLTHAFKDYRQGGSRLDMRKLALVSAVLVAALAIGFVWVWFTDQVKAQNPIGLYLTSSAISRHNFGTLDERISAKLWFDVVLNRALPQIFGYGLVVAGPAILAGLFSRRYRLLVIAALAGFLVPFLVFSSLHIAHTYYQSANALLILIAAGLGIVAVVELGRPLLAGIMLALILAGQLVYFHSEYAPVIRANRIKKPIYAIARAARDYVPESESLLVLGQDWSSSIAYYAERKSLTIPNWLRPDLTDEILADPEKFLGGQKLGGIVYCTYKDKGGKGERYRAAVAGREVVAEAGLCRLFAPTRSGNAGVAR
jgi:4-amino-4-deoxy-L-arabinose transferase-like glycosyltransferase